MSFGKFEENAQFRALSALRHAAGAGLRGSFAEKAMYQRIADTFCIPI